MVSSSGAGGAGLRAAIEALGQGVRVGGEGGIFRNEDGARFMERYDPKKLDLSARSIYTEVREGPWRRHRGAFLGISHKSADYVKRTLPSMYHQFLELGGCGHHEGAHGSGTGLSYIMGGIRVD
jgi:succinate dehydrogenase / fumarate reductase flavoprotein subunit